MPSNFDKILSPEGRNPCKKYSGKAIINDFRHYWHLLKSDTDAWLCLHAQTVKFAFKLDPHGFEDLIQTADIKLKEAIRRGKFLYQNKPPKQYFMGILFNVWRNNIKNPPPGETISEHLPAAVPLDLSELSYALQKISPLERALIVINKILGYSDAELHAACHDFNVNTGPLDRICDQLRDWKINENTMFSAQDISQLKAYEPHGLPHFAKTGIGNIKERRYRALILLHKLITLNH